MLPSQKIEGRCFRARGGSAKSRGQDIQYVNGKADYEGGQTDTQTFSSQWPSNLNSTPCTMSEALYGPPYLTCALLWVIQQQTTVLVASRCPPVSYWTGKISRLV